MRPWILGAILSGGILFVPSSQANAQMTLSFGRSGYGPGVSIGQPAYTNGYYGQGVTNNGYYGQPAYTNGYYGQPAYNNNYVRQPSYGVPQYTPNNYVRTYPVPNSYSSGYQGYAPAPGYYPSNVYPGYGYGNSGVNVTIPRLGPMNIR